MLRAQSFSVDYNGTTYTISNVYARRADEGAAKPYIVVSRQPGDRNETLDGNDESLYFTPVVIEVHSPQPGIDVPIAEDIAIFLEQSSNATMGSRILYGAVVESPEDFDNAPIDGSDDWNGGSRIVAHLEHN